LSVYTPVSESELSAWLDDYSIGRLLSCEPIKAGIENTNYFVTSTQGSYVLTLFERLPAEELPFYVNPWRTWRDTAFRALRRSRTCPISTWGA
jgi:homoserine kinase type II